MEALGDIWGQLGWTLLGQQEAPAPRVLANLVEEATKAAGAAKDTRPRHGADRMNPYQQLMYTMEQGVSAMREVASSGDADALRQQYQSLTRDTCTRCHVTWEDIPYRTRYANRSGALGNVDDDGVFP